MIKQPDASFGTELIHFLQIMAFVSLKIVYFCSATGYIISNVRLQQLFSLKTIKFYVSQNENSLQM